MTLIVAQVQTPGRWIDDSIILRTLAPIRTRRQQPVQACPTEKSSLNYSFQFGAVFAAWPLIVFSVVAAIYFVLCWPLSLLAAHMERRQAVALAA